MAKVVDGENVVCPYCNYPHGDAFEWAAPVTEGKHMVCDNCGRSFVFWKEYDVTYHSRDLEGGKPLMVRFYQSGKRSK